MSLMPGWDWSEAPGDVPHGWEGVLRSTHGGPSYLVGWVESIRRCPPTDLGTNGRSNLQGACSGSRAAVVPRHGRAIPCFWRVLSWRVVCSTSDMAGFHSTDVSDLHEDFVIDEVLRSGGTAMLVRARPIRGGGPVVLKILLAAHMDVPDLRSRFEREAEALALVRSPHVPELRGTGFTAIGRPYLILESLDGRDLEEELDVHGRLPAHRAVSIARDVASALTTAHSVGIVHRDVKPGNVFLTPTRSVLLDFGIAKIPMAEPRPGIRSTGLRGALGTTHYMSPEQIRCSTLVDARTDIWSLGALLFEMLTGRPPFEGKGALLTMKAILEAPTPSLSDFGVFPSGLSIVVQRCLAKDPALRWASATTVARALAPFATPPPPAFVSLPCDGAHAFQGDETTPLPVPPALG